MRIAVAPDGAPAVGRRLPGRGAWLCAGSPSCLEAAVRRDALGRALRRRVGGEAVAGLARQLAPAADEAPGGKD